MDRQALARRRAISAENQSHRSRRGLGGTQSVHFVQEEPMALCGFSACLSAFLRSITTRLRLPTPLLASVLLVSPFAFGQAIPEFSTIETHEYDTINLATLGLQLNVPIRTKAGHIPFSFHLTGTSQITVTQNTQASFFQGGTGLSGSESHLFQTLGNTTNTLCTLPSGNKMSNFYVTDSLGNNHKFLITVGPGNPCAPLTAGAYALADNSGLYLQVTYSGNPTYVLWDVSGNSSSGALDTASYPPLTDPNGNTISTGTDTLGEPGIQVTGGIGAQQTFEWTDALTNPQKVTLNNSPVTQYLAFGCSYDDPSWPTNLPTSILFPDNSTASLTYEKSPLNNAYYTGRLASLTLPTGGTISYTYSGGTNGINCLDGTPATMTRTTPDGQWVYTHVAAITKPTTTVTDPQGNNTVYTFSDITYNLEIERQVYNGAVAPANLIKTVITCYNNVNSSATNCGSSYNFYITEKDVYTAYPGVTGYSAVKTAYIQHGALVYDVKTFDFNATTPTNEKQILYGTGSPSSQGCLPISAHIQDKPCSVTLLDSQHSNAILSQTWNSYDGSGNLIQTWNLVSGSGATGTYLSKQYTYTKGVVQTAADVNGQVTNYTTTSCNNMFVTSQYPTNFASLTTSQAWDCNGGVVTSSTDANSQTTKNKFYIGTVADPFYRPRQDIDELGYITNLTYGYTSSWQGTVDKQFLFNGNASVVETLSTTDSIGRPAISQLRQGPASTNWDTTSRTFDSDGRAYQTSLVCVNEASVACSASTESQTYDALNRPRVHTGTGGDVVTKQYVDNDVLTTLTPAPANENAKSTQKEYDGLGRLKSVCVISSAAGSGPCGQANGGTGFLTTYSYDAAGRLLQTVENAQVSSPQQTRKYSYDLLGRVLSETNPESGTTSYSYDTVSGTNCTSSSTGDMVQKQDANGNYSCYHYDSLHRKTYITYAGPNSNNVSKYFVYDAATVNGIAMSNAAGRMAEAYTCAGSGAPPCTPTITDEGFSYDVRGQMSAYYQKSPNSNGYYNLSATYWEDHSLKTVSGVGLPTLTYGTLDGEGRVQAVSASSGLNPASGVTYNNASTSEPIGALLKVTLGYGDTQNFTYDPNSGRMTSYSASVGATPVVISGTLNWNPNGTLLSNTISDGYNSSDTQVCSYLYDDFIRVAGTTSIPGINCINGSTKIWNQTFTYDPFGNITKSTAGPGLSWACAACYNTANNHYNSTLSPSIAYDADGNLTNDTFHTYAWLADGHVASIVTGGTTSSVTYDALDNKVEESVGAVVREYVSAFGVNAQMQGTTEHATTVDLPGGVQALFSGGSLDRFRYPDWQGTIRAESGPGNRVFYESLAFAPFGERYALKGAPYNVDSFTGKPDQLVSDEYDFPAREEHNGQGRWVSPDPTQGTGNKYVYADNNPLSNVDVYGLETMSIMMNGLEVGTTDPTEMMVAIVLSESHGPASSQTGGQISADDAQQGSDSGVHFWQRVKNCFSGFCGLDNAERAVIQKAVDTQIQNERKVVEKACEQGCFGKSASDIKKLTPQEVDRFYEAVQVAAALVYFRGGASMQFRKIDVSIDPETGLVQPGRGVSVNVDPNNPNVLSRGPHELPQEIPSELEIIHKGKPGHFELAPREPMTPEHYQDLLNQVQQGLKPVGPTN
jgi:RHS repeat-associated protein